MLRLVLILCIATLLAPATARGVTLGMADDPILVRSGSPDALLDVGVAHNVGLVRAIVYPNNDINQYIVLAHNLKARGLTFHATLALPTGGQSMSPDEYAKWAADTTATLRATGVDLRVGLLNEPDLTLPAADTCTPKAVDGIIRSAGSTTKKVWAKDTVKVRKTKTIKKYVRRHGHRRLIRYVVVVTRRVRLKHRRGYRTVPVYRYVIKTTAKSITTPTERSDVITELTPRLQCFAIIRAWTAAAYLRPAITAVRASAPDVPVIIGETSPGAGVSTFISELADQDLPKIDGWADHPYWLTAARSTAALARQGFGRDITIDWTEFGLASSSGNDLVASLWRQAGAMACELGVRSLVAYQWQTEPDHSWDTSLMSPGLVETPQSDIFRNIAC